MGRTMPSASQVINQAEQSFAKFRGAMRREDQRATIRAQPQACGRDRLRCESAAV
jgi:hypothetical protein